MPLPRATAPRNCPRPPHPDPGRHLKAPGLPPEEKTEAQRSETASPGQGLCPEAPGFTPRPSDPQASHGPQPKLLTGQLYSSWSASRTPSSLPNLTRARPLGTTLCNPEGLKTKPVGPTQTCSCRSLQAHIIVPRCAFSPYTPIRSWINDYPRGNPDCIPTVCGMFCMGISFHSQTTPLGRYHPQIQMGNERLQEMVCLVSSPTAYEQTWALKPPSLVLALPLTCWVMWGLVLAL